MKLTQVLLLLSATYTATANNDAGYISPDATGLGWEEAFGKARNLVAQMTLEEKLNLTIFGNGVPRLGFLGYTRSDGSNGPSTQFINHTAFESSLNIAASLDRDLMYKRGYLSGAQLKKKGYNVLLGPNCNMMRSPQAGRNFEVYGPEPYLSGIATAHMIKGVQDAGTITVTKHYIANEQEHGRQLSNSVIDSKTFNEVYDWPFADAVHAGATGIMSSYNLINGIYAGSSPFALGQSLKGALNFQGYVVTDFTAERVGEPSIRAGQDSQLGMSSLLEPPGALLRTGGFNFGSNLTTFIENGTLPLSRIDDAARRMMTPWFLLGQDQVDYPTLPNDIVTDDEEGRKHNRKAGAASAVLLKNVGHALPLKKPKAIALFGIDAGDDPVGPNEVGRGYQTPSPGQFRIVPNTGANNNGTLASGWGSAFTVFPYLISPATALSAKAKADGSSFVYVRDPYTPGPIIEAASKPDTVCMVFAASASGEEIDAVDENFGDRNNITSWQGADEVVNTVASRCSNTVVIVHAVGPLLMPWADNENVTAIIHAGLPGQESGNSLVDVLYGDYNPSAKLPFTIAYNLKDYPAQTDFSISNFDGVYQDTVYTEGVFLDYRHFDKQNITPRYPFGFGLSYTKFGYSSASVKTGKASNKGKPVPGGQSNLFEEAYSVKVKVKNTGKVAGHATPQLYITLPDDSGEPPSVMRGFDKVYLKPGQSKKLTFSIRLKDLSIWNEKTSSWTVLQGKITAFVGENSRDKAVKVTLKEG